MAARGWTDDEWKYNQAGHPVDGIRGICPQCDFCLREWWVTGEDTRQSFYPSWCKECGWEGD